MNAFGRMRALGVLIVSVLFGEYSLEVNGVVEAIRGRPPEHLALVVLLRRLGDSALQTDQNVYGIIYLYIVNYA